MRLEIRPYATAALLLGIAVAGAAETARAICDVIPHQTRERHRGAIGSVSRPFASPGEWIDLAASPRCAGETFVDPEAGTPPAIEDDYRILLAYEPPRPAAPRRVVLVAESCAGIDLAAAGCGGANVASAQCIEVNQSGNTALRTRVADDGSLRLELRLPRGACSAGEPRACYRDADCTAPAVCDVAGVERVLTGPLTIAARSVGQPPPCDVVAGTCAAARGAAGYGACVDAIYAGETGCGIGRADVDPTFPGFTALPPPNDFASMCDRSAPYEPACHSVTLSKVRAATDVGGNLLVPLWWDDVLSASGLARFVAGSTAFPARLGGSQPIRLRERGLVTAHTRDGVRLPAFLQVRLAAPNDRELALYGTVDASHSVLRIARRGAANLGERQCVGGTNIGEACRQPGDCPGGICEMARRCLPSGTPTCSKDADCTTPGDECGRGAHDMASWMQGHVGAVEIPRKQTKGRVCNGGPDDGMPCPTSGSCAGGVSCADYRAQALWPVPLHHTEATPDLIVAVLSEPALVGEDLDGDGAFGSERVAVVYDARSRERLPIGASGAPGRAVVSQGIAVGAQSFAFPVVAASGPVVALIEDCALRPASCDGGTSPRLRVYRREPGGMSEVTTTPVLPASDDFLDGRPIAITPGGRVLYRAPRAGSAVVALHVLDALASAPAPTVICAATRVSVSGERAVFLRPEADGPCRTAGAPVQLNDDTDHDDTVVQRVNLASGAAPSNLRCAATNVVFRGDWIAAAVSEAQQGGASLNGDGDSSDDVLHVHPAIGNSPSCSGGRWMNAEQAVGKFSVAGNAVAFLTSESAQDEILNDDGDKDDDVMQVAFATTGNSTLEVRNVAMAAEEFALGDRDGRCGTEMQQWLAFRTGSGAASTLQLYDVGAKALGTTVGTDVRVCDSMSCDPRRPYAVDGTLVRVLASCVSGAGDCVEVYDACRQEPGAGPFSLPMRQVQSLLSFASQTASLELGGRCVEDLGEPCGDDLACRPGSICLAARGGKGKPSCHADSGWCRDDGGCPSAAHCRASLSFAFRLGPGAPPGGEP